MKDIMDNFSGKVTTEKVLLLKSSTHQNVVAAIPPRLDENLSSWHVPPLGFGEVLYTSGYWEWVEDLLARCKETLDKIKTYDVIFASMFTYDHNENVFQAFYENQRPSTNTVSTFIGELSISLCDLRTIGGLLVHGSFYDEVIPSAKELTHVDDQGKSFLPRSCSYLFSAFYRLTKGAIDGVSFREWTKFWFRELIKNVEPSPRTSKNRAIPRMNHDPSGNIDMGFLPRTEKENAPFVELGKENSLRDEAYLAAFLHVGFAIFILVAVPSRDSAETKYPHNLRGQKKDYASLPTKGEKLQEKFPHSLKSKVTPNIPPQSVKVISKSKNLKGKATHVDNGVKNSLQTPKEANITDNEVINVTLTRKKPSSPLDKSVEKSLGIAPSCSNTSKTFISLHEIVISTSATSSSNESNVSQELYWKRLKKKPKDLNNQQCEFAELDSINGATGSTIPLTELAHQLGVSDIPSDVDVFEDCITSPNSLNVAKSSHLPLVEVKSQADNEIQLTKLMVPFSEKNVAYLMLREVNIINPSPLEVLLEDFFKKHGDYDVARLSTSQEITRDSHQELISNAQQFLDTANEERINMDK
ncbi:hypothetical protein KY284_036118 [Solanum tuberosum]|nr:hypothetical protein KY284_036118 [Solanum tuberosum]